MNIKRLFYVVLISIVALAAVGYVIFRTQVDARVEASMEPFDCPPVETRVYPAGYYVGPLWDTHVHIPAFLGGPFEVTSGSMACTFRTEGTDKVFGFFSVYGPLAKPMVEIAARTVEEYPGQFVPFIMPPDRDDRPTGSPTVDAETLGNMLALEHGLFDGYGEIGLYAREGGAAELPPDDPKMLDIYRVAEKNGLVVYVHLGRGHDDNLERAADLFPGVRFIFHGDQLIAYGEEKRQDLSVIDGILERHPNVFYGIDELYGDEWLLRPETGKEEFLAYFESYEPLLEYDLKTWEPFIGRHPDQVMWGTDRGWSAAWTLDPDVGLLLTDYARAFIGRLDPDVQARFAYLNAARMIGDEE